MSFRWWNQASKVWVSARSAVAAGVSSSSSSSSSSHSAAVVGVAVLSGVWLVGGTSAVVATESPVAETEVDTETEQGRLQAKQTRSTLRTRRLDPNWRRAHDMAKPHKYSRQYAVPQAEPELPARSYLLRGATVLLPGGKQIENGEVVVSDNVITFVGGPGTAPPVLTHDLPAVDLTGYFLSAGFVDAHTHIGQHCIGATNDNNEKVGPVNPHLRALDGIDHRSSDWMDAIKQGITTVVVCPGSSNVVGGQCCALKTRPGLIDDKVLNPIAAIKVALGDNPKGVYGPRRQSPMTRMGVAYQLRMALIGGQEAADRADLPPSRTRAPAKRSLSGEAMALVALGKVPLKIHCHRADDIATAIRITDEFNVKFTLDHVTQGHRPEITKLLGDRRAQCLVGPILTGCSKAELNDRTESTAAVLHAAGARVSLVTDHPVVQIRHFLMQVDRAVRSGLPPEAAFDAITLNPAAAAGVDKWVGSISPGKDADLVVLDKLPSEPGVNVKATIIEGDVYFNTLGDLLKILPAKDCEGYFDRND